MAFADFFKALFRSSGSTKSENIEKIRHYSELIKKAEEQIRKENNRLQDHKYNIRDMESSILQHEKEWRAEISPNLRRILGRQMEGLFMKLKCWEDIENVIFRNLHCWELIEEKARALKSTYESDVVNTDIIDDLMDEIVNIRGEQKVLQRAEGRLREQNFEPTSQGEDDEVEKLLASFRLERTPAPAVETVSTPVETVPATPGPPQKELLEE